MRPRSFSTAGMRARLEQRLDLLLERAPDAGQLGDLALARHGRDRARRLAHRLGGVAVGEHAVHDGAVELVEVGQLVEERGDGGVGRIGHGRWSIRYAALHDRTRLARPAHLQRGREPRDRRRRRPSRARRGRARGLSRARRRRRLARRHGRHRRRAGRGAPRRGRGAPPARARGPGSGVPGGLRAGALGRRGLRVRDGRRPLARPGGPRAPARRRARRRRRPRPGLALRARRRRRRLGRHPAHRQPRRVVVRAARPGPAGARPHGRLQVLSGRRAARDRPAQRPLARLRLPGRADLPHHRARAARGRGADRLPRPRAGDVEDVLADHRRGGVARSAAAPGRRAPPTSGREPSRRRHRRAESTQGERQRARPRPGHG